MEKNFNGVSGGVWRNPGKGEFPERTKQVIYRFTVGQRNVCMGYVYKEMYHDEKDLNNIEWLDESLQPNGVWPSEEEIETMAHVNYSGNSAYKDGFEDACKWLKSLSRSGGGWSDEQMIEFARLFQIDGFYISKEIGYDMLNHYKKNNPIK